MQTEKCKCQNYAKLRGPIRKIEHRGNVNMYLNNTLLNMQDYADEDWSFCLCNIFKMLSNNNIIKQASKESCYSNMFLSCPRYPPDDDNIYLRVSVWVCIMQKEYRPMLRTKNL